MCWQWSMKLSSILCHRTYLNLIEAICNHLNIHKHFYVTVSTQMLKRKTKQCASIVTPIYCIWSYVVLLYTMTPGNTDNKSPSFCVIIVQSKYSSNNKI